VPYNPILQRFFEKEFRPYRYRPVEFARRILEIDPHDGQQKWLLNSTATENALTTGNQFGKSFIAALKFIWRASYRKGWTDAITAMATKVGQDWEGMNLGPSADQSQIVWRKGEAFLKARRAQWLVKDVKYTPFPMITLFNGAKIQARTTDNNGEGLLGHTLDFVNWDEAAREKKFEKIRDDVLRMRLVARRGMLDYTTTGNGRNDYGKYFLTGLPGKDKDPDLYSQAGTSFDNPYLPRDWLEKNARRMPDRMRRQNIGGEIVDAGGGFFSIEDLEACENPDLTRNLRIHLVDDQDAIAHAEVYCDRTESGIELSNGVPWHARYPTHRYVHFWDLARKKDFVVGITLDTSGDKLKEVEFERFNKADWSHVYARIRDRHNRYGMGATDVDGIVGSSKTYLDLTGVGDVVADAIKDIEPEGLMFTKSSKDEILSGLQSALSMRELEYPMLPVQYDECKFYERDDKDLVQDTVMALAGAVHFGRRKTASFAFEF
jgi:hypothetical protein